MGDRITLGIGLGVLAYTLFALHDASNKGLVATLPVWQVMTCRSATIVVAVLVFGQRKNRIAGQTVPGCEGGKLTVVEAANSSAVRTNPNVASAIFHHGQSSIAGEPLALTVRGEQPPIGETQQAAALGAYP